MSKLEIYDPVRELSWTKTYDEGDGAFSNLKQLAKSENCRVFYEHEKLFTPFRTKDSEELLKDLFLPTFFSALEKTESVAENFFHLALSMVLDILTLPVRLITVIPRVLSNTTKEENEFYQTLKRIAEHDEGGSILKQALQNDYVNVNLEYEDDDLAVEESFCHKFTNLPYFDGANDSELSATPL